MLEVERASLAEGGGEVEDPVGVAAAERVHVERRRHARGDLAGVAERGEAAHDDVVRLPAQLAGPREEPSQVLASHGAAGARANAQGVFWKRASPHSPGSSRARAARLGGPASAARQRDT